MDSIIRGKVWIFGESVSTDMMAPGKYGVLPLQERKFHCMEPIRPDFGPNVKPGDIIVASKNFGCGSSRESAPRNLKDLGVGAIIAGSFARIFFRNSIAIGLPVIVCPEAEAAFKEGDELTIDFSNFTLTNTRTGKSLKAERLPDEMFEVLVRGGIVPMLKEMVKAQ
jgi:3-isopropylmalate/(R)-2-methylmalate dehydratase small subunit